MVMCVMLSDVENYGYVIWILFGNVVKMMGWMYGVEVVL